MKLFLFFVFTLLVFVSNPSQVFANDLEVVCADSACAVSSNAPLFETDINWIPERVVTKSIIVTNSNNHAQELVIAVKPTSSSPIDDYIFLHFEHADQMLWQGTLAQLFGLREFSLVQLEPQEIITLSLTASMDPIAPNQIQNASSVFDFSFKIHSLGQSEISIIDGDPSSSGSYNQATVSDKVMSEQDDLDIFAAAAHVMRPSKINVSSKDEPNQVLEAFHAATEPINGNVLGSLFTCQKKPFWGIVLIFELAALLLIKKLASIRTKRLLQGLIITSSALAVNVLSCSPWHILFAGTPTLLIRHTLRNSNHYFSKVKIA